ncbi:MAG: flavin reductase family protein [Alphaproteobacteria bacterium]|nr:flavin reductase family protein [Rhodospirillales bacterium]MCW9044903.1 flavin reductase family protein [Alphaproteobacteria bacterium]
MTTIQSSFRDALGRFATGIVVVTGEMPDGSPIGITVNSFSSLSLDPPLILFCLGKTTEKLKAFIEGENFVVNVLAEDQMDISNIFAKSQDDSFNQVKHDFGEVGCALIDGALAQLECKKHEVHDNGDHYIVVGEVVSISTPNDSDPLLFFKGGYRTLGDKA